MRRVKNEEGVICDTELPRGVKGGVCTGDVLMAEWWMYQ